MSWGKVEGGPRRQRVSSGYSDSRRHGLTSEEIQGILDSQGGRCALCHATMARHVVDHDHRLAALHPHPVGRGCRRCVRGLLCYGCNSWLQGFRDDPEFLRAAADYSGWRRRQA